MNTRIFVSGLVENSKDEILLLKRAPDDSRPNEWELPGGSVEFGEDPSIAMSRELEEETFINLIALWPMEIKSELSEDKKEWRIRIYYKCVILSSEEVLLSKEHSDYKWVTDFKI